MDERSDNPYAAPKSLDHAGEAVVLADRIHFSGIVDRSQLRNALRTRFSWSGLATLITVAAICFALNPDSLSVFWSSARLAPEADALGELVGVVGLGFMMLSVWHVLVTATPWGVGGRERAILQFSPHLYDAPTQGYLDTDHLYLDQPSGKVWLSWRAMGMCQFARDLLIVHWTKGVAGNTVLTQEMFDSPGAYQQVSRILASHMSQPDRSKAVQRSRYLEVEETKHLKENREPLATAEQRGGVGTVMWTALLGIPLAILRSSRPLHRFFGMLMLLALITTRAKVFVALTLFAVWGGIWVIACVLSILQNKEYFFFGTPLLSTRRTFFPHEIHFETAFAYFVVPIEQFRLVRANDEQLTLQQKDYGQSMGYRRSEFPSEEEFRNVRSLFSEPARRVGPK